MKPIRQPTALTIAGSDSGGGAGIQADLKTLAALGVHGTSVLTCLTAQNPKKVLSIQAGWPDVIRHQLDAVFSELRPAAVKTGMLLSVPIIHTVALFLRRHKPPRLIVDPVMVASSGARLLQVTAIKALQNQLLPLADLVTPNLDEARLLTGEPVKTIDDMRQAARHIHRHYHCAALIKGGHLPQVKQAIDIFYDGRTELWLEAPMIRGVSTHGTGCTYSAAVAGYSALGCKLPHAVQLAKEYITQAVAQSVRVRNHTVLNHFWH